MARINDVYHSDIYITPDRQMFVPDTKSEFGLVQLEPDDFEELKIQDGEDIITLITCHPYRINSHRYIVKAKRKK